jgi:hypothetical protein
MRTSARDRWRPHSADQSVRGQPEITLTFARVRPPRQGITICLSSVHKLQSDFNFQARHEQKRRTEESSAFAWMAQGSGRHGVG